MMRNGTLVSALLSAVLALFAGVAPAQEKAVSDDVIHDQVRLRLAGDTTVQGGGVVVDVREGAVTLRGKVRTEKGKTKATSLVKKIKGVKSVDNKLVVDTTTP